MAIELGGVRRELEALNASGGDRDAEDEDEEAAGLCEAPEQEEPGGGPDVAKAESTPLDRKTWT